jgi:hypothetical protein
LQQRGKILTNDVPLRKSVSYVSKSFVYGKKTAKGRPGKLFAMINRQKLENILHRERKENGSILKFRPWVII